MRIIFDLLHKLLNSEMFCLFHNCVWQSRHSEINVVLLFSIHQYGSLRSCLIFFNMFTCQHATFCGFVSTYGSPRTRWISDIVMCLLIKSVAIKLGTFQGFFTLFCNKSHHSCPHIGLTVLDNWVFGFGWIRWESLLLLATSESKSNVQSSFRWWSR